MAHNVEKKAKMLITYAIENATTLGSAVLCFNECASQIKQCNYEDLCTSIDEKI